MLIIEGPDSAGKTTLVQSLSELMPEMEVYKSPGPIPIRKIPDVCHDFMEMVIKPTICDRCPMISESVYGPLLRGNHDIGLIAHRPLESLKAMKTPVVYCRPPLRKIMSADHPGRPEEDPEHVRKVNARKVEITSEYDRFFNNFPHIQYDWTVDGPNFLGLLVRHVIEYHKHLR